MSELDSMTKEELTALIRNTIIKSRHPLKIFGMQGSIKYAEEVAKHLNTTLSDHVEKTFDDGEIYTKSSDGPTGNVRGHDVFVVQSLFGDGKESVNDKFMKLAIFIGSLRQASAYSITAVIPHLAYARQDRKTESRAPVTSKIVAAMLEAVGVDRTLFVDVHNLSAQQNAFSIRCPMDNLEAKNLHADWVADKLVNCPKITVLSPDAGGYARTDRFTNALQRKLALRGWQGKISVAVFDKLRVNGAVKGGKIIGDVEDADVVSYDDMISTASTMAKSCKCVKQFGGRMRFVCATHGLFVGKANEFLAELDPITKIVIADTVDPFRLTHENRSKVEFVSTTKMVADAISRIHTGTGSLSELLK